MTLVKHSKEIWYVVIYFIKWLLNTEESSLCLIPVQFTCQSHWDYLMLFEGLCSSSIIYEWGVFCFQLPNWESLFCIQFFNTMNKVYLSQMSKCYSFAFDALKSITKNHEPLLVQYSGSTAHLLDAAGCRYTWPLLPSSRHDGLQLGSRNQLNFSHPTCWGARVIRALGSQ